MVNFPLLLIVLTHCFWKLLVGSPLHIVCFCKSVQRSMLIESLKRQNNSEIASSSQSPIHARSATLAKLLKTYSLRILPTIYADKQIPRKWKLKWQQQVETWKPRSK